VGYKALLTLDLENGVSAERRQKVYEHLKQEKWAKLKDLTTVWKCSFNDDVSCDSAIRVCKQDVANATKNAGVYNYNVAVQVGQGEVEEF
jgi:hypothetical protein